MSTSPDQPLPSAPKSPLSGAVSTPAPAPSIAPAGSGLSKPAFKVTRSPFSPRITGAGAPASAATATPAPAVTTRKVVAATGDFGKQESPALVVLDLIAAGVAIAAAVLMALAYFKR